MEKNGLKVVRNRQNQDRNIQKWLQMGQKCAKIA